MPSYFYFRNIYIQNKYKANNNLTYLKQFQ